MRNLQDKKHTSRVNPHMGIPENSTVILNKSFASIILWFMYFNVKLLLLVLIFKAVPKFKVITMFRSCLPKIEYFYLCSMRCENECEGRIWVGNSLLLS